jgi:TIR domain
MITKVFISHASEDKDRFVLQFAERLRQNGIDAWLDKWEMLPGDSLIDKIFEEGIKEAKAVIVVLSKFSVEKPWVREELNAACVNRINNGSKLIPVVIDDCEVPEALKSLLWESITDLSDYKSNLERIVAAVFGTTDKPPIGSAPSYVSSFIQLIGTLNDIDSLVLRLSCEEALENDDSFVNPGSVFFKDNVPIVPEEELEDSLEILDSEGYIQLLRTLGGGLFSYQITTYGFEAYAKAAIPEYQSKVTSVISAIVNENFHSNIEIQKKLRLKIKQPMIVDHILDVLESNGHIRIAKNLGGTASIYNVSPSLKRFLRGN